MKAARVILVPVLAIALAGCASNRAPKEARESGRAAKRADAASYGIDVLVESSAAAIAVNAKQVEQIRAHMETDLVNILTKRGGFKSQAVASRDKFTAGPKRYLVAVKVLKYNAGSKAARMLVGYGAGSASLDIQYDIIGENANTIVSKVDGVGSSRDWYNCVRKLNERIHAQLNTSLSASPTP